MRPVIYIDTLFVLNFIIDSIIIYTTGKVSKTEISLTRLSLCAAFAAFYSTLMFFPVLSILYTAISKVIFSALLVAITFNAFRIKKLLKTLAIFYLVSFTFGGAVFALMYLTNLGTVLGMVIQNGEMYLNLPIGSLMLGIGIAYIVVIVYTIICRRNYQNESILFDISISVNGKTAGVKALVDTGSSLNDPLSQKPVMVVEFESVKEILPCQVKKLYTEKQDDDLKEILKIMEKFGADYKFRVIPFSALGTECGIMLGVVPDSIEKTNEGEVVNIKKDIVVAICNHKLSEDGGYNALLNPEILDDIPFCECKSSIEQKNTKGADICFQN